MSILGRLWNWWHSWIPSTSYEIDQVPQLVAGECVYPKGYAIRVEWHPSTKGRHVLTSHRLFYLPLRYLLNPSTTHLLSPSIEIDMCDIKHVGAVGWFRHLWGGYPGFPRLVLALDSGRTYAFQVDQPKPWRIQIDRLRPRRCRSGSTDMPSR